MKKTLYEIALEHGQGFGYLEVSYLASTGYHDFLFSVINRWSPTQVTAESFIGSTIQYLIAPSVGDIMPPMRKKTMWRTLVQDFESAFDATNISFKFNPQATAWRSPDWPSLRWFTFEGYDPHSHNKCGYASVKHLPFWRHMHPDVIVTRLTMLWIKKSGRNILDFYPFEDMAFHIQILYYEIMNTPFYDGIDVPDVNKPYFGASL